MKTATVSEFRAKMREHLEDVARDQDILILSGPRKKDFVLITLAQYNSMEETAHLLSTPANTEKLMESIAEDKAGLVAHAFRVEEPGAGKKAVITRSKKVDYGKIKGHAPGKIARAKKGSVSLRKKQ